MKRLLPLAALTLALAACHKDQIKERDVSAPVAVTENERLAQVVAHEKNDAIRDEAKPEALSMRNGAVGKSLDRRAMAGASYCMVAPARYFAPQQQTLNTEEYDTINENGFHTVKNDPLSTFSIDVDVASYANLRRYLNSNQVPPVDAVRSEELINYFHYDYPQPEGRDPFSITTEIAACPWAPNHQLMLVGLKGKTVPVEKLPPSNLVFLIDVSGSMQEPNKLPLLKQSFRLLVNQLREKDRISMVVYAGQAGLVLPSTRGDQKEKIFRALDGLEAGGSTAGGAGIQLAYSVAQQNFIKGGINRVILATDGDFNVGVSNDSELVRIIEEKRKSGVFLSVLGYGMGNYKDSKMEKLADKGNGNYAYIDNLLEAKKVLVTQMGGTLNTIAKDVKIQVEFNPAHVQTYRLIGYENRLLNKEDFNNDKKDAGELGAGHEVTALYEIVPVGVNGDAQAVDPLKYQRPELTSNDGLQREFATVKLRYKHPAEDGSNLITHVVNADGTSRNASENVRFASAVAGFGMLLRNSEFKGSLSYGDVARLAKESMGEDKEGYRAEFIKLVRTAEAIGESAHASIR